MTSKKSICDDLQSWEASGPANKLRSLWNREKQFHWYFGEINNDLLAAQQKTSSIIVSADHLVHPYIIGTSGSGKTEALKTILLTLKNAYRDDLQLHILSGSNDTDLDVLARHYSQTGNESIKPAGISIAEKLSGLLSVLKDCQKEALRRNGLFKKMYEKTGKECLKISQYRKMSEEKLPEIVVVIDDFSGYAHLFDYESDLSNEGTVANLLSVGYSQWRKSGIHILITSQEAKARSLPSKMFSDMSGGLVLKLTETDQKYMKDNLDYDFEGNLPIALSRGEGMFRCGDLQYKELQPVDTKTISPAPAVYKKNYPIAIPYMGSRPEDYINFINCSVLKKTLKAKPFKGSMDYILTGKPGEEKILILPDGFSEEISRIKDLRAELMGIENRLKDLEADSVEFKEEKEDDCANSNSRVSEFCSSLVPPGPEVTLSGYIADLLVIGDRIKFNVEYMRLSTETFMDSPNFSDFALPFQSKLGGVGYNEESGEKQEIARSMIELSIEYHLALAGLKLRYLKFICGK